MAGAMDSSLAGFPARVTSAAGARSHWPRQGLRCQVIPSRGAPAGQASLVFATSTYEHKNDCDSFRALIDIMALPPTAPEGAPPRQVPGAPCSPA